mmetsp:Transcript_115985/g.339156  ORF Transcript_115985/g.339156 Transcript_115985/m.339156 type:complete len:397 (-) Transcript_115985:176-1366(-)
MSLALFQFAFFLAVAAIKPPLPPSDTTEGYLANYGINVSSHFFTTKDGYILHVFRLPRPGAPVVLLQHGVLASSWCWLVNTPEKSAGIVLWKMGYDVWLTNSRGNTYSRNHTRLHSFLDKKFWDYTFDDMANYDVPTNVDNILKATGKSSLTFVGWSQGTTQMFIAASGSQRSWLASRINLFVALSPVTYMKHQRSLLLALASYGKVGAALAKVFPFGFLDAGSLPAVAQFFCTVSNGTLCAISVDSVCGTSALDDVHAVENLTAHFPAGTSVKDLNHYAQFIQTGLFRRYDYGAVENLLHYFAPKPPVYNVSELAVKTALFIGTHDDLAGPLDTHQLRQELQEGEKTSNLIFAKEYANYSHVTWLTGKSWAWFEDLQPLLKQYNPLPRAPSTVFV